MKTLVSVKKILTAKISSKSRELIGSLSQGVSNLLPHKKDDASIAAVETVDFAAGDDDRETERRADNFHRVIPTVAVKPQPEAFMLSKVEEIYSVPSNKLNETISALNKTLQQLNFEHQRLLDLLEQAYQRQELRDYGKKIMSNIISGEDYKPHLSAFEAKLRSAENIPASITDFLVEAQQQLEHAPLDKRGAAVLAFCQNDRLLKYIKSLSGFKCQICGFTFEQEAGEFYAEAYYLEALSGDGKDSLDQIIVLCPNHKKMFEYANLSIRYATQEAVSVELNGRQHTITRLPLR